MVPESLQRGQHPAPGGVARSWVLELAGSSDAAPVLDLQRSQQLEPVSPAQTPAWWHLSWPVCLPSLSCMKTVYGAQGQEWCFALRGEAPWQSLLGLQLQAGGLCPRQEEELLLCFFGTKRAVGSFRVLQEICLWGLQEEAMGSSARTLLA